MIVNTDGIRDFLQNHGGNTYTNEDLNSLVIKYKDTKNSDILSSILQKTLGMISLQAKKLQNPDFTESDAYSHGFEIIIKAINKWDPNSKTSFSTLVYLYIHNAFDTLAYRSKQYRSYIYKNPSKQKKRGKPLSIKNKINYSESSLESMLEEIGDSIYDSMPRNLINENNVLIRSDLFLDRPLSRKIINFLINKEDYVQGDAIKLNKRMNGTNKKDIAMCLNISLKELNRELSFIKKQSLKKKISII